MNCTKSTARKMSRKLSDQLTTPPWSAMAYSPFRMAAYISEMSKNISNPLSTVDALTTTESSSFIDGGGKGLVIGIERFYPPSWMAETRKKNNFSNVFPFTGGISLTTGRDTLLHPHKKDIFYIRSSNAGGQKKLKKVDFLEPGNRMLRAQKSLVFDVAALSSGATRCLKKVGFFRTLGHEETALFLNIFDNLMNPLAAQVKLVSNLAEGVSSRAHLQNFGISRRIRRGPWLQWSPLPTRNCLDCCRTVIRKLIFSATLPHVADPSPKGYFFSIYNFYVNCWNVAVSFAGRKLLQSFDVCVEACNVVHGLNIKRGDSMHVNDPHDVSTCKVLGGI